MKLCKSSGSITSNEEVTYYLMNTDDILKEMTKTIHEIKEILGLPSNTIARLLLNHFRWDQVILTDRYWENPDKMFRVLSIPNPSVPSSLDYNPASPASNSEKHFSKNEKCIACRTCCMEKPKEKFFALTCSHQHCLDCWKFYIEACITGNSNLQKISCPSRCNQIMEDEQIYKLLGNNDVLKNRYKQIIVNTFVDMNRLTHWCPGNSCSLIVKFETNLTDLARMVECDNCKSVYCFACSQPWHEPLQCSLLKKWEKKNRDESMTSEWILANTKECPSCHSNIEKNGGCNHMTCKKPGCLQEFCWICLGTWKDHGTRPCNVFEDDKGKSSLDARENLARYMHYFTRYRTHEQSLALEEKLALEVEKRIHEMQSVSMSYTDQQAVYKAFEILKQCRRTLKYTYAFAFYVYRNNQAEVFAANQADLELATEALSGFLEREITIENMPIGLMDKIHYCDKRQNILLKHCKEGYIEHYWGHLDPY